MPHQNRRCQTSTFAIGLMLLGIVNVVQAEPIAWRTDAELRTALDQPTSITWSNQPLGEGLRSFARLQRVALLLDRRIDPNRSIAFQFKGTLSETFAALAQKLDARYVQLGPVAYIGPAESAKKLLTLAEAQKAQLRKVTAPARRAALLKTAVWQWEILSTPRGLLEELADVSGVQVEGVELITHDLWPAAEWPAMSWLDRLMLITAQFDLMAEIDPTGNRIVLSAMPDEVFVERDYPAGAKPDETLARLKALAPDSRIEQVGDRLLVHGPFEDHQRIAAGSKPVATKPVPVKPGPAPQQVLTLKLDNLPLKRVLESVARQLETEVTFDEAAIAEAGIALDQLISINVEQASTDALFNAILNPAKLKFTRTGPKAIRVEVKE